MPLGPRWEPRKRGYTIGRVYFAHPSSGERYYLRMLLNTVRGATSWEDLLIVNGHVCHSFKEACREKGLLEDDAERSQALEEVAH
jgi:hypothetical protein